ncbi:MAG: helix-turn-helix transcriptional regulator [Clostridia bacterium]|nr:helix-turn-helix transcriptional regulator [Clostridia bacterium]
MIREDLETILGEEFRFLAIKTRERLKLTQKEMSDRLQMSDSSYSDIERGINNPSALTAVLLLNMQEDPNFFLNTVNEKFQEWYEREMMTV